MKGQLSGLKARLGSQGEGASGFPGQRRSWSGASIVLAAGPWWDQAAPAVTMPSCRQDRKKVQRDVLYGLVLITTFIMFNKLCEQPAPVPCVLLQLVSL